MACYKLKKSECQASENCQWIVSKGCKSKDAKTKPDAMSVIDHRDVGSIIKKNLSFIDAVSLYKAKQKKRDDRISILRVEKNGQLPSTFAKAANIFVKRDCPTFAVGNFDKMPFIVDECERKVRGVFKKRISSLIKHGDNVYSYLAVDGDKLIAKTIRPYDSESVSGEIELHKNLRATLGLDLSDFSLPIRRHDTPTISPKRFTPKEIIVDPKTKLSEGSKNWIFDFDGFKAHLSMNAESLQSVDGKNIEIKSMTLSLFIKVAKPAIEISESEACFKENPQDVTLFWSTAYNAVTSFLDKRANRDSLVESAIPKRLRGKIDYQELWNKFSPAIDRTPLMRVSKL